jgi:hypothetical protein
MSESHDAGQGAVDVFGREAGVALAVKPLNLLGLGVRNRPAGAPPQAPVQKPVFTFLSNRRLHRRNVLSIIAKSCAASSRLNLPASQRLITSRSFNILRPCHCSVRRIVPSKKGRHATGQITGCPDRSLNVLATGGGASLLALPNDLHYIDFQTSHSSPKGEIS